jgi:hypothetical protein
VQSAFLIVYLILAKRPDEYISRDYFYNYPCLNEFNLRNIRCLQDCVRQDGCYCFVSGPAYESMAESRFLLFVGGDSVGMVR